MKIHTHTISAMAYIYTKRHERPDAATWFDVAEAYDAGLYHGVEARKNAQRALAELRKELA